MNTNTYTPSKELLSAVLNEIVIEAMEFFQDILSCKTEEDETVSINLYELAIKTKQKYPDIDLNLAATDISEFWRQANELVRGAE